MKKILKYLIFFYSSLLVVEIIISLPNKKESKYSTNIFIPKKISFNNEKIYPLSGLPNKEIIFCKNNLREYVYISDKLGFNNNNKIYNNLSPKILILGDYLIHADCVKNNNYLVNLLNNKLNIVNFAYPEMDLFQISLFTKNIQMKSKISVKSYYFLMKMMI